MAERRERKVVTVLFADLVGFTSRAETMDPEDVADELGRYQARVRAELERYGGTVEKFIGDAAMAIFGAPVAYEDDPERAVRAALVIRDWAAEEEIEIRVGINTGEALVTLDARPESGETMAAGDVVNTAARLQSAAPVNGIFVGEQTYRATQRTIDYRETQPVQARGKAEPVVAWEAVEARARISVERVHGAALVGRRREVDLLEDALARTLDECSSQLVTIVGVPGIGKSRIVLELYEAIERHPAFISWRQGRCLPYGDGVTFWALGEMVKAQAGILDGDEPAEAERKLRETAGDPWVESHLRPLVGLPGGAEGGDTRDEAFAAWRRYFEGLADERPLVLVFEDLHWADEHLLEFVDYLVEWATGVPLLVVGTARPELLASRPDWGGGKPNALTISLSPLSDQETAILLSDLLGPVLAAETQADLLARAGGNPLYAEEFARVFRDRGQAGELPETVQGLIAARLDLLDPEQKALLQDAAVIGKRFWAGAVRALAGEGDVAEGLHALERKEFVRRERPSTIAGDEEFSFRHLLVRDVAYGQIPRADRAEKHRLAAGWIEQLGRREDHAEMLAHHYLEAMELAKAAGLATDDLAEPARQALQDAGDRAYALNAVSAATRFFRSALELALPDTSERAQLLLRLGRALHYGGEPAAEVLLEARDALLACDEREAAAEAETELAGLYWLQGERDHAFEHLDGARELAAELETSRVKAYVAAETSRFLMLADENEDAIRVGREALAMAEELGLDELRARALNNIGSARTNNGDAGGIADVERAVELAAEAQVPFEICRSQGNLAAMFWLQGELDRAEPLIRRAHEAAVTYGQPAFARWFRAQEVVNVDYQAGRWNELLAGADAFIAEVEAGSPHYLAPQVYATRANVRAARDDVEGAVADADRGIELARPARDPQLLFQVLAETADVLCGAGEVDRAERLADEVLAAIRLGGTGYGVVAVHVLSWTLTQLGRGQELIDALAPLEAAPAWRRAATLFASGDPAGAAEVCASMGALAEAARARLAAARSGVLSELEPALAFYRSVGATRFVREGEALLVASA